MGLFFVLPYIYAGDVVKGACIADPFGYSAYSASLELSRESPRSISDYTYIVDEGGVAVFLLPSMVTPRDHC